MFYRAVFDLGAYAKRLCGEKISFLELSVLDTFRQLIESLSVFRVVIGAVLGSCIAEYLLHFEQVLAGRYKDNGFFVFRETF